MPRRRKTGANLLTIEQLMAVLNMTREEIMVLVSNGIPHIKRNESGRGVYYLFPDREVLAVVKPLPFRREVPVTPIPKKEDEGEAPVETVRPEARSVPSMEAAPSPSPETGKTTTKPKTTTATKPKK